MDHEANNLSFIEFSVGFYRKGLELINPEKDDFSIISGCLLLVIGLEKLIKQVLVNHNPLMILEKVGFDDVLDVHMDKSTLNKRSVSLEMAFERLTKLFPEMEFQKHVVKNLVRNRNFLAHSAGIFNLKTIENNVRVNVTTTTGIICEKCLNTDPYELFGKDVWQEMLDYKEAYEEAEILELEKRISFLKRIYSEGKKLPCAPVKLSKYVEGYHYYDCPICKSAAIIEVEIDVDVDHREGVVLGAWPYPNFLYCENCGFSLIDSDEIEILVGEETLREILYSDFM